MLKPAHPSTAIIGAGIAGLACARRLHDADWPVTLFEKSRGSGGRLASRRLGKATVDLGAQFFSVRDDAFHRDVEAWHKAGKVAAWPEQLWKITNGQWRPHHDGRTRYVGVPRMSSVTRHLADGLSLVTETRVTHLSAEPDGWWLSDQTGLDHGPFDRVVITAPSAQAQALVEPHDTALTLACRDIVQRPCWAAWARFDTPLPSLPGVPDDWQAAMPDEGPLRFIGRNDHKPGRERQGESLTLLARLSWSQEQLESPAADVAERLLGAFQAALPDGITLPTAVEAGAHRWRFAQPDVFARGEAVNLDYRLSPQGLALCGDGWRGPRVEDAWLSGHHLAQALMRDD